jgi:hypothetical protein
MKPLLPIIALTLLSAADHDATYELTHINPHYMVSIDDAQRWHAVKDVLGPSFAGTPSWRMQMTVIETKLRDYGAVGIVRNNQSYQRWSTTEWPDDSHWTLVSNDKPVKVASYGANSGSTPPEGTTANLIYYDPANPPASIEGKIVAYLTIPETEKTPADKRLYAWPGDYMYLSNPETFPDPKIPRKLSMQQHLRSEMQQANTFRQKLIDGKAAGAVFVFQAGYGRVAGLYTFGVPPIYQVPTLYLDRDAGRQVIEDAKQGKQATLRLISKVEPTECYQLFAYLPGRNYGTPQDEQILLSTHTDGPSISEDDGGYGLLAVAAYFSHFTQAQRPRTIFFSFDDAHFVPQGSIRDNWLQTHPELWNKVVAGMGIEHLGQLEYVEKGDKFVPTGQMEHAIIHAADNDKLIEMAIQAVKDNHLRRTSVQCIDRPGIHGADQGTWFGYGGNLHSRGLPAFAIMGDMAAYWSTVARVDHFDAKHFLDQMATMSQLTGDLMVAKIEDVKPKPPKPRPGRAGTARQ